MGFKPVNLVYRAYQLIWEAFDWLYPPNCGGCGVSGTRWCKTCDQNTPELTPPICPICGNPNHNDVLCERCKQSTPQFTALRSHTIFRGPIREALHRLKYKGDICLGEALARPMIDRLVKLNWPLDIITSVPLGLVRFEERGYNQATLLARPIAYSLKIPFSSRVLSRTRETRSQVGLSVRERQQNMDGAFKVQGKLVQGKNLLVVDDVATSGATLNACAKALRDAGANRVYGFSLTRAVFSPDGDIDIT